jgi:hypothetical protein
MKQTKIAKFIVFLKNNLNSILISIAVMLASMFFTSMKLTEHTIQLKILQQLTEINSKLQFNK